MARYKPTVIFDVREDKDRERRDQLAKKFLEKKRGKATIWPTQIFSFEKLQVERSEAVKGLGC
jgi:hypothetical protein